MGKGRKIDDGTKERVIALAAAGWSYSRIKDETGVSKAKTSDILNNLDKDAFEQLRTKKREQFIDQAWVDIDSALELGRQKVKLATVAINEFQRTIDKLIDLLENNKDTNGRGIIDLIKALSSVTGIPLAHISTYVGTLYDKQALAQGKPTEINDTVIKVALPEGLNDNS